MAADLRKFKVIFFLILKMVYLLYEAVFNENTQHTFVLKKTEKISIL